MVDFMDEGLRKAAYGRWAPPGGLLLVLLFLTVVPVVHPPLAHSQDVVVLEAHGEATSTGDTSETKRVARTMALRNAVTEALASVMEKTGMKVEEGVLEREVYSEPERFVINYKILSETWTEEVAGGYEDEETHPETEQAGVVEVYRILLEARVDSSALRAALSRVVSAKKDVFIKLVILDVTDYETYASLREALGRIPVVEDISYASFSRGRFVLRARTSATSEALSQAVSREAGADFVVSAGGPDIIIIKAFPEKTSIKRQAPGR